MLHFIDGMTPRRETPEQYVRQDSGKSLVREYRYAQADIARERMVRVGGRKPRADLFLFPPGTDHTRQNEKLITECKSSKVEAADQKDGVGQLQAYMASCPNVTYGMWTYGVERFCDRQVDRKGSVELEEVPDIPPFGWEDDAEHPPPF